MKRGTANGSIVTLVASLQHALGEIAQHVRHFLLLGRLFVDPFAHDLLLGAHLVGAEVTELVQGFVIGKQAELTEEDFMATVFPHPTLSEMMHESVLDAYGQALHI